ncbi:MAG: immunoglobulin domain-containing protein [Clostridia bacterium]|nr:immunoglobulin domain-containing protein [Clostridia bacterium]
MKRISRMAALLVALLLLVTAMPASADPIEPTRRERQTFYLNDDDINLVLPIDILNDPANITDLEMHLNGDKKAGELFSKCKPIAEATTNKIKLSLILTAKKAGKVSFEYAYSYRYHGTPFSYIVPVTLYVETTQPPVITKHPTGERVQEGGSVTFIAHADNANSVEWFLTNGHDTLSVEKALKRFAELRATGYNEDTLVLKGVPAELDAWDVFASFTNAIGTSDTNLADIFVYTPLTLESDEPYLGQSTNPVPTPRPAATVTPIPTMAPAVTPIPTKKPAVTPYNGTKLAASDLSVFNAAGQDVALTKAEADKLTGNPDDTWVLVDAEHTWLRFTNPYGAVTASLEPVEDAEANGSARKYILHFDEKPTILKDHNLSAAVVELSTSYGFTVGARMILGFDGRDILGQPFDFDDPSSGWRYAVEIILDRPFA